MKRNLASGVFHREINSPLGLLQIFATDKKLLGIIMGRQMAEARERGWLVDVQRPARHPVLDLAEAQLSDYFAGRRRKFSLPLELRGTEFQRSAWQELQRIPYGQTISYGEQSRRMGKVQAQRAVGQANGKNPLPIVVPCHRVVSSSGGLGGYSGGLKFKRALLNLERAWPAKTKS